MRGKKNRKIYQILSILLVLGILFFIGLVANDVQQSVLLKDIRAEKDLKFLLVSTNEQKFEGAFLLDYSIKRQAILVFPINAKTRFIKNNVQKPVYLQDIYQRIYYRNRKDSNGAIKQFMGTINEMYDLDIDYFVCFSSADVSNINQKFGLDLDYSKIMSYESDDISILDKCRSTSKFLSMFNIFEFFRIYGYDFSEKVIKKLDTGIPNSNINLTEIFCLLTTFSKVETLSLVFVGSNNVLYDNDNFYIRDTMKNIGKKPKNIVVEVLNGSGKKGMALVVTRLLRDNNLDVQQWGNYSGVNDLTMVIDRKSCWENAQNVANVLGRGIVFSKQDKNSFIDVSVILGKDAVN